MNSIFVPTQRIPKILIVFAALALVVAMTGCTSIPTPYGNGPGTFSDTNALFDTNQDGEVSNLDDYKKVQEGDNILVHYVGKLQNGEVFDSSIGKEPLSFEAGAGEMIQGFDDAVLGMREGETKTVVLPPEKAYGQHDSSKVKEFPKSAFEDFPVLKEGVRVSTHQGLEGTITGVDQNSVKVDFNPSLAGKTLTFEITLVSINK